MPSPGRHGFLSPQVGVVWGCLGLLGRRPYRYHGLCQLPLLARRGGFPRVPRGDGGAGAGPAVVAVVPLGGSIGVPPRCHPGRHWWLQACPFNYLLMHQWRAVGSAVWRCEGGEGGEALLVVMVPGGQWSLAIHRHWGGRRASHSAHLPRNSSESWVGARALATRGLSDCAGGSQTRWTAVTSVTFSVRRKACTPSRASRAGRRGRGTGAVP